MSGNGVTRFDPENGGTWRAASYGSAQWINNGTGGADYQTGVRQRTYQWRYRAPRLQPIRRIKLVLPNVSCPNGRGETPGPNAIAAKASVLVSYRNLPFRFAEKEVARVAPGAMAESDALEIRIPADTHYWIRVCIGVGAEEAWPIGPVCLGAVGQGFRDGDWTAGGSVPTSDVIGYCPAAVLVDSDIRTIAGIGDSIMHGWGDCFSSDADGNIGWFGRMAKNLYGQLKLAASGARADQFRLDGAGMGLLRHADVVIEAFGRNDVSAGYSLEKIVSDRAAIWKAVRARYPAKRLLAATIVPVTVGNRPAPESPIRNSVNEVLRRHVGSLIDGVVDICPAIETRPGSNIFKAGMSGAAGDWTHLSPEGYAGVARELDPAEWVR